MASVYQSSAGVTNAKKLTISMWCRAHTTNAPSEIGDYYRLLEFGNPDGAEGETNCYIDMLTNCTGVGASYNVIDCKFGGVKQSVRGRDICTFSGSTDNCTCYASFGQTFTGNPGQILAATAPDGSILGNPFVTPYVYASTVRDQITGEIDPEKWFHLMIAIDATASSAKDSLGIKMYVSVNGTARTLAGPEAGTTHPTLGTMTPLIRCEDSSWSQQVQVNLEALYGPIEFSGLGISGTVIIPGFEFDLNGFEIGIPSKVGSPNKNTQLLDMADVQIWVGQYIDPTVPANFEKFVNNVDGRKYPVSPFDAAIAFGNQTYLFTGNSSTFYNNQGTGGVFAKSGTLSDIPGPSI